MLASPAEKVRSARPPPCRRVGPREIPNPAFTSSQPTHYTHQQKHPCAPARAPEPPLDLTWPRPGRCRPASGAAGMEGAARWYRRRHTALPLWLAAATVLLLAAAPPPAAAQMISPLAGQNSPGLNTTEVFMSAYLDRLLEGGWWWWCVVSGFAAAQLFMLRLRRHMPRGFAGPKVCCS